MSMFYSEKFLPVKFVKKKKKVNMAIGAQWGETAEGEFVLGEKTYTVVDNRRNGPEER